MSRGFVIHRIDPPPLWSSDMSTTTISKPAASSSVHPSRTGRHHDAPSDDHELAQNVIASSSLITTGSGTRSRSSCATRRVERGGADDRTALVERTERQVEVVHPGWAMPQPDHRDAELVCQVLEGELLGSWAVADDEGAAQREGVTASKCGPMPRRPT